MVNNNLMIFDGHDAFHWLLKRREYNDTRFRIDE